MGAGRPRTANVLKLLNGSAMRNPERLRDDAAVTPKGRPTLPPWVVCEGDTKTVYEWLVAEFALPGVHGKPDGLAIFQLAEVIVQRDKSWAKLAQFGPVMKNPANGKLMLQPYYQSATQLTEQVRKMMSEIGFTPQSRLKFAPPLTGKLDAPKSWDEID